MITTSMCKTNLQEMNFSLIKFEIIAFNSNDHFISNITIKEKYFLTNIFQDLQIPLYKST